MTTPTFVSALPAALAAATVPDLGSASGRSGDGPGAGGAGRGPGGGGAGGGDGGIAERFARVAWIRQPTLAQMMPFWPDRAVHDKLSGVALLACELRKPGHPRHCKSLAEEPAGSGFGAAAVAMSGMFLLRPMTRNGVAVDLPVLIPVNFTFEAIKVKPAADGRSRPTESGNRQAAATP